MPTWGLTPFWHAVYLSNRYLGFWVSSLFSWPGIWTIGYLVIRTTGKSEHSVSGNLENCEFSLAHITRFTLLQWNEHSLVAPVLFWNEQSLVEKPDQLAVHFFQRQDGLCTATLHRVVAKKNMQWPNGRCIFATIIRNGQLIAAFMKLWIFFECPCIFASRT